MIPGLLSSVRKDLQLRLADPLSLLLWVGIPILLGGLMSLAFGGGSGAVPKAELLLADEDDTFWTRSLARVADGAPVLEVQRVRAAEGRTRILAGEGTAYLRIPKGASQTIIDGEPLELTLVTNPSQRILPGFVEGGLEILAELEFYIQRGFGDLIREVTQPPAAAARMPDLSEFLQTSRSIHRVLESAEEVLFPPVLRVEMEDPPAPEAQAAAQGSGGFDFGLMMFPGIMLMTLLFMSQGMSLGIWSEREAGTLLRLSCTPHGARNFLLSKICAGALMMAAVVGIGLLLGWTLFGLSGRALPLAGLWCTFCGACILSLFCVLQMLASSLRGAEVLTTIVVFPMMMLGGSFFPFEAMPRWMVGFGQALPNGTAILQLKAILQGEVEAGALARSALWLAVMGLVLFFVASRLIQARAARP